MPVYFYDPPDRFVAGAVGQPGERIFYLQATSSGRVASVVLEKFQVSLLAERIDELLDEVLRCSPARHACEPPGSSKHSSGVCSISQLSTSTTSVAGTGSPAAAASRVASISLANTRVCCGLP